MKLQIFGIAAAKLPSSQRNFSFADLSATFSYPASLKLRETGEGDRP